MNPWPRVARMHEGQALHEPNVRRAIRAAVWSSGVLAACAFLVALVGFWLHIPTWALGVPPLGGGLRIGDLWLWLLVMLVTYDRLTARAHKAAQRHYRAVLRASDDP